MKPNLKPHGGGEKQKKIIYLRKFLYSLFFYHIMHSEVEYLQENIEIEATELTILYDDSRGAHSVQILFFYFFKSNRMLSNCAENHLKILQHKSRSLNNTQKKQN
mgnify:FL=1